MLGGRFVHLAGLAPVPTGGPHAPGAAGSLALPLAAEAAEVSQRFKIPVPRQRSFTRRGPPAGARAGRGDAAEGGPAPPGGLAGRAEAALIRPRDSARESHLEFVHATTEKRS
jgi:hypothetical protein